jgi:hypothetical protein
VAIASTARLPVGIGLERVTVEFSPIEVNISVVGREE